MGWILATISKTEKGNWDLCKKFEIWGVSIQGEQGYIEKAEKEDRLLFWVGGSGFVGTGIVKEKIRIPKSEQEIPWRGGAIRYGFVVPFKLEREFTPPRKFLFKDNTQVETQIPLAYFRRGFQPITDKQAETVLNYKMENNE